MPSTLVKFFPSPSNNWLIALAHTATTAVVVDGGTPHSLTFTITVSPQRMPILIEELTNNASPLPLLLLILDSMMSQPTATPNWKLLLEDNQFQLVLKLTKESSNYTLVVSFQADVVLTLIMLSLLLDLEVMVQAIIGKLRILGELAGVNKDSLDS